VSKRIRPPAVKRDPVIAALIAKLPAEAAEFSRALRVNWLRQVAMAFDGAYGVQAPITVDQNIPLQKDPPLMDLPNPIAARPAPIAGPAEVRYFIDADGFARKDPGGVRIKPHEVPDGAILEDEREGEGELDTIKWADGPWPVAAWPHPLTIIKA
jgi:hypothetical protein